MRKTLILSLVFIFPFMLFGKLLLGQFTEVKNLSEPRGSISTVVFGDSILFVGGSESKMVDYLTVSDCQLTSGEYGSDGFTSSKVLQNDQFAVFYELTGVNLSSKTMYVYDNGTKEWSSDQYPNGPFQDIENGFIEGNQVVFIDNDDQDLFYTYDFLTNDWGEFLAPFSRRETTVIEVGEKIFFIGGKESFSERSDSVHVYNKANASWEDFNLSEAKNGVTAVQYEDKIVIAGGQSSGVNSNNSVDLVEIIDVNDYTIDTLSLSQKKNDLIGVAVGNKVIFSGGNSQNAEVINMDDYSLTTHEFDINQDLKYLNGGVVGNQAVFAGGNDGEGVGDQVFVYDDETETWSTFTIDAPRSEIAFVTVGNKLFAAGGEIVFDNGEEFDELFILETEIEPIATCSDGLRNGEELRIDCGGPGCPDCIPLMYDGEYTPEGQLEIFLTLPPYWYSAEELQQGIYYEMTTGFNNICEELTDCQPFLILGEDDNLFLDVYKKNLDGDILGFGRLIVESQCLSCQPPQVAGECPNNLPLAQNTEILEQENGYMMQIEMLEGTPPFRVQDVNYNLFYEDGIDSMTFYLGLFPDTLDLNLIVYDFWGCKAAILYNPMVIDTTMMDTTVTDTMAMDTTMTDTTTALFTLTQEKDDRLRIQPSLFEDEVFIYLPYNVENTLQINAITTNGEILVLEQNEDWTLVNGQTIRLQTSEIPNGLLYFSVTTDRGMLIGKGVKY